jgi:hypothetical protein
MSRTEPFQRKHDWMMTMSHNHIQVKVLEAYTKDVGRGVARLGNDAMAKLGVAGGDVVAISGKRLTVALCLPLYPTEDQTLEIVRVDGLIRRNADVEIGELVLVSRSSSAKAEKITVAPLEPCPPIDPHYLAEAFESVAFTKGDMMLVPYFGGRLTFRVAEVYPLFSSVMVTKNTEFTVLPEQYDLGRMDCIIGNLEEKGSPSRCCSTQVRSTRSSDHSLRAICLSMRDTRRS